MNSTCVSDVGYFDTPEFLSLILHINTIISTPIHIFGFYCIKWKTPIAMKSAKPYLLNLHLWMVLSDYSFSILTIPYLLIPQIAGYTLGVFSWFDVPPLFQIMMILFCLSNFNASMVSLFESRFFVVCKFAWKPFWKRWRIAATVFYHIFLSCNVPLLGVFAPVQETAIRNMFTKLPCLPQYTSVNIFVLCEDCSYHLTYIVAVVMFCGFTIVSFAVILMWNAIVQLRSRTMSEKTFRLQKSFLIALGTQILTPLSMFGLPVIYIWIAIIHNYYNQTFTNFSAVMVLLFLANMIASIVAIFESRFYTVCDFASKPYWKRWRRTGFIFYHVVLSCVAISFGFLTPDQETAKRNMFAKLPCLPQYIYEANNFVLCEDYTYHLFSIVAIVISASAMVLSFAFLLMWNSVVQLRSRTMSHKTFQLQKSFLIALGVQITVPLCTIVIPAIYLWIELILYYYNQAFNNFAVCSLSMHGFLSSMVMVLVHRPYRETLFSFFKKNVSVRSGENSFKIFFRYHRNFVGVVAT
ncbi:unnamed protein product [Caenorhabditis nigoni]